MKRYDYNRNILDVFRIFAALQVFAGHMLTHFHWAGEAAVYFVRGVPILFALCGFLAAKSLDKYTVKEYLKQRAARVLPGFWFCILVNTVLIAAIYRLPSVKDGAVYLFTQFFGLNFYTGDWLRGYGVGTPNGVLWTIGVQIQFFLLAPLIKKWLGGRSLKTGLSAVAVLTIVSIGIHRAEPYLPSIVGKLIGVTVLPYAYFLVLGMLTWYHREVLIAALAKVKWYLLSAYVLWKFAEIYLPFPHLLDGVLYNTVTTLLLVAAIFGFAFEYHWRNRCDLTYGFYLYHMVIINVVVQCGYHTAGWLLTLLIAAATLVCAYLSQRWIEQPIAKRICKR